MDLDPVITGDAPCHVDLGKLVDIHRNNAKLLAGINALTAEEVRLEKILEDDIGMRPMSEAGQDRSDSDHHAG